MELIQTVTLGSAASSITFSSIPATYDDLLVKFSLRDSVSGEAREFYIDVNSTRITTSNQRLLVGSGSSAFSTTAYTTLLSGATATANTFGNGELYIPNYRSTVNKSVSIDAVTETNGTAGFQVLTAALSPITVAITSLALVAASANFVTGASASLYGIKSARSFAKATGGTIFYDAVNNKVVHVFTASGTFTPTANITCEYLVIAGGGGGGSLGGGAAGGYRSSVAGQASGGGASAESTLSLTSGSAQTVTVGAGGGDSASGSNSVFGSITSTGGGGGAVSGVWRSGGSGAGATAGDTAGSGTANQGFAGGVGATISGEINGGGGGGAGSVGGNAPSSQVAGNGGNGVASNITGTSITRAGGGGGGIYSNFAFRTAGTGGTGGGGNGGRQYLSSTGPQPTAGAVNTGSGGGGRSGDNTQSGLGGSGIVIVRYDA